MNSNHGNSGFCTAKDLQLILSFLSDNHVSMYQTRKRFKRFYPTRKGVAPLSTDKLDKILDDLKTIPPSGKVLFPKVYQYDRYDELIARAYSWSKKYKDKFSRNKLG